MILQVLEVITPLVAARKILSLTLLMLLKCGFVTVVRARTCISMILVIGARCMNYSQGAGSESL